MYFSVISSSHKVNLKPRQKQTSDATHYVAATDSTAVSKFKQEIQSMIKFTESLSESSRTFGAFTIKSLALLADEHGRESDEYTTAVRTLKEILNQVCFTFPRYLAFSCTCTQNLFDSLYHLVILILP